MVVNDNNFEHVVLQADKPVLVDFWAQWCGYCLKFAPVIGEIAAETEGQVIVAKLDVDSSPAVAQRFRITGLPTLIVFSHGQEVSRIEGTTSKAELLARLAAARP